jgi:GTPase SAR1 family protein
MHDEFRAQTIEIPNGNGPTMKAEIKKGHLREVFKFNQPPYLIIGASNCGKTTLAVDLIHEYAPELTYCVYMTATSVNINNDTLRSIPKLFIRKPTFENLRGVWNEILRMNTGVNIEEEKLKSLVIKLYPNGSVIIRDLMIRYKEIINEQNNYYSKLGKLNAQELATSDARAFMIDTIVRLLVDKVNISGSEKLNDEEMSIVMSLVSVKPRILLILDDVTSELAIMKSSNSKVFYDNTQMPVHKAFESLLLKILTTGRHAALVAIFVHSIDIFDKKEYLNNLILMDMTSSQKISNARSYPVTSRAFLMEASQSVFDSRFQYHFISISMEKQQEILVCKARMYTPNEPIKLSPIMTSFVNLYNKVSSGEISEQNFKNVRLETEYDDSGSGYDDVDEYK